MKSRKIYNEVVTIFNDKTQKWDTIYEDSFQYGGPMALAMDDTVYDDCGCIDGPNVDGQYCQGDMCEYDSGGEGDLCGCPAGGCVQGGRGGCICEGNFQYRDCAGDCGHHEQLGLTFDNENWMETWGVYDNGLTWLGYDCAGVCYGSTMPDDDCGTCGDSSDDCGICGGSSTFEDPSPYDCGWWSCPDSGEGYGGYNCNFDAVDPESVAPGGGCWNLLSEYCDCYGNVVDCAGTCGGSLELDNCGYLIFFQLIPSGVSSKAIPCFKR